MATEIISGPIGEIRLTGAANGVALTTTAAFTAFPVGTNYLFLTTRNYVTAVVARFALNPYLAVLKTTDKLAATANLTDGSKNMNDEATGTTLVLNSLNTGANNNYLYVGAHIPFRGVRVVIGNTNSNAATLAVNYWNGTAWTNITPTDGTALAGAVFGQTGNVTWTMPTDWATAALGTSPGGTTPAIAESTLANGRPILYRSNMYWTRWDVSAQLDATVTWTNAYAMNRATTYAEILSGTTRELRIFNDVGGVGCVEALTDAGTANMLIEAAVIGVNGKFGD